MLRYGVCYDGVAKFRVTRSVAISADDNASGTRADRFENLLNHRPAVYREQTLITAPGTKAPAAAEYDGGPLHSRIIARRWPRYIQCRLPTQPSSHDHHTRA